MAMFENTLDFFDSRDESYDSRVIFRFFIFLLLDVYSVSTLKTYVNSNIYYY